MEQYQEAAAALRKVRSKKGSLRTIALAPHVKNKRFVYATVSETLKKQDAIEAVLQRAGLKTAFAKQVRDPCLLTVLLYDLLFGKGIQGGGSIKRILTSHEEALKKAKAEVMAELGSDGDEEVGSAEKAPAAPPIRYVRVNTLKMSVAEAIQGLTTAAKGAYNPKDVELDPHVEGLLVLPGGRSMHDHPLVRDGRLVLQDKASCFPAQVLLHTHQDSMGGGGDVIDACAAPGNKTAQLAAGLARQGGGRVFAFDKCPKRLALLRSRVVAQMGAGERVVPLLQDFLAVDPEDPVYSKVRAILLDPSCSGSGMDSLERRVEQQQGGGGGKKERQRLLSLSQFQYKALTKAFSFPQVERVVYSTCSVHAEENECVVAAALRTEADKADKEGPGYRPFVLRPALEGWPRRGMKGGEGQQAKVELSDEQLACLVRADPREDRTTGFFVAYFERREGPAGQAQPKKKAAGAEKKKKRQRQEEEEEEPEKQEVEEEEGPSAGPGDEKEEAPAAAGGKRSGKGAARRARRKRIKAQQAAEAGADGRDEQEG